MTPSMAAATTIRYVLDLAEQVDGQFDASVSNLGEKATNINLIFEEKNNILEKEEVKIFVDLGSLFARWQQGGAKGINVKALDDDSTQVQLLKSPAKIMDIPMEAGESQNFKIIVDALEPQSESQTASEYTFSTRSSTEQTSPVVELNGVGMSQTQPIAISLEQNQTHSSSSSTDEKTLILETTPGTHTSSTETICLETVQESSQPVTLTSKEETTSLETVHGSSSTTYSWVPTEGTIHFQVTPGSPMPSEGIIRFQVIPSTSQTVIRRNNGIDEDSSRYTDNRDGTVTDNQTGLIWLKNANCLGSQYPSIDKDSIPGDGKVSWQNAQTLVKGLNTGHLPECDANHNDWRLPTVQEIQSLVHYGFSNPAMSNAAGTKPWQPDDVFSNVKSDNYWTSTPDAANPNFAWRIRFDRGLVFTEHKTYSFYVWPVRDGNCVCP